MSEEISSTKPETQDSVDSSHKPDKRQEEPKESLMALGYSVDKPEEPQKKETDSKNVQEKKAKEPAPQGKEEAITAFNPFESETESPSKDKHQDSDYKSRFESTRSEYLKATRQLAQAQKTIGELIKTYDVEEGAGKEILSALDFKHSDKVSFVSDSEERPFIMKVVDVVNQELPTFKKYNTSADIDKFLSAFERWYVSDSSAEDKEIAHKALKGLVDDPAQLIQKISQVGETLYKKIYSSLEKSGGLLGLLEQHAQTLTEKDKTIERLTAQLDNLKKKKNNEEDDYIASTGLKIDSGKSNRGNSSSPLMSAW